MPGASAPSEAGGRSSGAHRVANRRKARRSAPRPGRAPDAFCQPTEAITAEHMNVSLLMAAAEQEERVYASSSFKVLACGGQSARRVRGHLCCGFVRAWFRGQKTQFAAIEIEAVQIKMIGI
jgi:hypothetical protein